MSFKTKISFSLLVLAAALIGSAGILYWGTGRAAYNLERSNLAHEELESYLSLSAQTYRIFNLVRRDMVEGNGEPTVDLQIAKFVFEDELSQLKAKIDLEFLLPLRLRESSDELERLAGLTTEIGLALEEVAAAQALVKAGQRETAIVLLTTMLETRIDGRVGEIIESGLADERQEVAEAKVATDALIANLRLVAWVTAILAAAFASGATWFLLRHLRAPLSALSEGTSRIAAGHLDHRIQVTGHDEFAALARRFNNMAGDLKQQRKSLETARDSLENTVTERTAELREANRHLENRAEMRRQFFADVGHELRTPITVIRGEAEVALRTKSTGRENVYRQALEHVVEVSGQLTNLVNDLFLIARSQAGSVDMRKEPVDLKALVEAVTEEMQIFTTEKGAELCCEVSAETVLIKGDSARLRQLLMILIDNAIQHCHEGVCVKTVLTVQNDIADLCVNDTGPGISETDLENLFERFYRGNTAGRSSAGGSGLGLPIAKTIVNSHGGRIFVESELGSGTSFCIHLPLVTQKHQIMEVV